VSGAIGIPVGATLVRGSDPAQEVLETHAKAAGVLRAFGFGSGDGASGGVSTGAVVADSAGVASARSVWADDPEVLATLASRNERLAPFWLTEQGDRREPGLVGRSVLIVDHEDAFTSMLEVLLRALGLEVTRTPFELVERGSGLDALEYDVVVLGPGPGDPRDLSLPKMRSGRALLQRLLDGSDGRSRAVLGICLGHQLICGALGFELVRKAVPSQGDQQSVDLFGQTELVGFYNSFTALAPVEGLDAPAIELAAGADRQLVGMRAQVGGARLAGFQFHPESVLSRDGLRILRDELLRLIAP